MTVAADTMVCRTCGEEKLLDEFVRRSKSPNGRYHECRLCSRAARRVHYAGNREYELARAKTNEAKKTYEARYREEHREERREKNREYYHAALEENRARARVSSAAYRERNREQYRKYRRDRQQRVHREMDDYSLAFVNDVLREQPFCCYCGGFVDKIYIDHIVPYAEGGPTSWINLAPSCNNCNLRKGRKSLLEFLILLTPNERTLSDHPTVPLKEVREIG